MTTPRMKSAVAKGPRSTICYPASCLDYRFQRHQPDHILDQRLPLSETSSSVALPPRAPFYEQAEVLPGGLPPSEGSCV